MVLTYDSETKNHRKRPVVGYEGRAAAALRHSIFPQRASLGSQATARQQGMDPDHGIHSVDKQSPQHRGSDRYLADSVTDSPVPQLSLLCTILGL